ncbi:MAG: alkaline phosphatase family protein [Bacteroidetes bacterium]|nr:alkaline phosphatase family protein [Bacteroidota bacterium]
MHRSLLSFLLLTQFCILTAQSKQTTILISFDGFRWDYIERGLSPTLDSLRTAGVTARSLQPVNPTKTFPNHLAIVTGMYPEDHGIIQNDFWDRDANRRFRISDTVEVRDPRWYTGEAVWETARKAGKSTASYFWPGSELNDEQRRPQHFEAYDQQRPYPVRVAGVLRWLALPEKERPDLVLLYFDAVDTHGHQSGPSSSQVNNAIAVVDSALRSLVNGLRRLSMADRTNIIVVSDHGMSEIVPERTMSIDHILSGERYRTQWNGTMIGVESLDGRDTALVRKLRSALSGKAEVFLKKDIPSSYRFSRNRNIPPVMVFARNGWSILPTTVSSGDLLNYGRGSHGYDSESQEMHGIFVAGGPAFRSGSRTGTIRTIDVHPLLCRVLGIRPHSASAGEVSRTMELLRN